MGNAQASPPKTLLERAKNITNAASKSAKRITNAAKNSAASLSRKITGVTMRATESMRKGVDQYHGAPTAASISYRRSNAMLGLNQTSLLEIDFNTGEMIAYKINLNGQKSVEVRGRNFEELVNNYNTLEPICQEEVRYNGTARRRIQSSIVPGKTVCKGGRRTLKRRQRQRR